MLRNTQSFLPVNHFHHIYSKKTASLGTVGYSLRKVSTNCPKEHGVPHVTAQQRQHQTTIRCACNLHLSKEQQSCLPLLPEMFSVLEMRGRQIPKGKIQTFNNALFLQQGFPCIEALQKSILFLNIITGAEEAGFSSDGGNSPGTDTMKSVNFKTSPGRWRN